MNNKYTYLTHCMLLQHLTHSLLLTDNMYGLQSLEAEEYDKDWNKLQKNACDLHTSLQLQYQIMMISVKK
jgi:hypothetical protein